MPKATVIIPARYAAKRLPAKALADLCGKPMIQYVYERAEQAARVDQVIVATDDERIQAAVRSFGGQAILTAKDHPSGTDRIAEVAEGLPAGILVNLQVDMPLLVPQMLDDLILGFQEGPDTDLPPMGTLSRRITRESDLVNPHVVKVVTDRVRNALYFSRAVIPYPRDAQKDVAQYRHYGVYIYQRDFLQVFTQLPVGKLEQVEKLEQLRAIENGYPIRVIETLQDCVEVNTPEDLEEVRGIIQREQTRSANPKGNSQ